MPRGPLRFELQLQFFVNEARTPIEDASVDWPDEVAPYVTVGVLTLPPQAADDEALVQTIEAAAFDPWAALMEHRPLGEVMARARRFTSRASRDGVRRYFLRYCRRGLKSAPQSPCCAQ